LGINSAAAKGRDYSKSLRKQAQAAYLCQMADLNIVPSEAAREYKRQENTGNCVTQLGANASQAWESTLTCIPYLRPPCLAQVQLKNFLSFSGLKFLQLPHTACFTGFAICHPLIKCHKFIPQFSEGELNA
jgi:hypothetical protein